MNQFFFQEDGIQIAPNSFLELFEKIRYSKETPETQAKPENTSKDDNSSEGLFIQVPVLKNNQEVQVGTKEEEKGSWKNYFW